MADFYHDYSVPIILYQAPSAIPANNPPSIAPVHDIGFIERDSVYVIP